MADTLIASGYGSIHYTRGSWGPYWISPLVGVVVFHGTATVEMARTTDGGATWSTTTIDTPTLAVTSVLGCWFDQETPGDTGTLVHVAMLDSSESMEYATVDISDGTVSSLTQIFTTTSGGTSSPYVAITKTVGGNLLLTYRAGTGATLISGAYKSTNGGTTWSTIATLSEGDTDDHVFLYPANTADNNDAAAIFLDESANQISIKMYDDSADSWTETIIDTITDTDSTYLGYDAAVRHSDGHILVAVHDDTDSITDDLYTYDVNPNSISTPSVTQKTDVFTNLAESMGVSVIIDQQTDDVYIGYAYGASATATNDLYYKKSTDGMATWAAEVQYSESNDDTARRMSGARSIGSGGGQVGFLIWNDDTNAVYYNSGNDTEIAASGGGGGGGSTGQIKVWNGSAWVAKPVKVWNGSAWVTKPVKVWNGSAWVETNY